MNDTNPTGDAAAMQSLIRTLLALFAGWLVRKGYISADQAPTLGGAILGIGIAIWGVWSHYAANRALKAAIAAPAGKAQ